MKSKITDRNNVFYWQTDRAVEPKEAGEIWADRHRYFTDQEVLEAVQQELKDKKIVTIKPLDSKSQNNLGNVNSVRTLVLEDGQELIVRCHPKGIKNGYFYAEALVAKLAKDAGLPSYGTYAIHDPESSEDFAFQVIEKMPGKAIRVYLEENPIAEEELVNEMGRVMAKIHQIKVDGFGPFDNDLAKEGKLKGLHSSFSEAVLAALDFNLGVLVEMEVFNSDQAQKIKNLFTESEYLKSVKQAVLVHNDFADWNLLTDGQELTGVIDWDEAVALDWVADIACFSTFFDPKRLAVFLEGYWETAEKPEDFRDRFELMRLRYTLSKLTLRLRKYAWGPTEGLKKRIEFGKMHLAESLEYFGI